MKKRSILCLLLCLILLMPVEVYASAPETKAAIGCNTLDASKGFLGTINDVEKNAENVLLYEVTTDTLMYAYNPDVAIYPSSLTKIMTAMIVLENANLSDTITVTREVLDTVPAGAAIAKLYEGEILTVEALLYSMMVDSANDSAALLAVHTAGSQEAFVELMNEKAASLGCTNTHFVNVHGLHHEEHVSTVRDIARIIKEAIKNAKFIDIFETVNYTIAATNKSEKRRLLSGNFLRARDENASYYDSRVTGGRTGVLTNGLRCIAATSESNGLQMISVLIGAKDTLEDGSNKVEIFGGFYETTALLDAGFNGMAARQLIYSNQTLRQCTVENGDSALAIGPAFSVISVLPTNLTEADMVYKYTDVPSALKAPVEKGQKVSSVDILYNGVLLTTADLFALNSVGIASDAPVNIGNISKGPGTTVVFIVVAALLVVILFLFGSRFLRKIRLVSRRKRIQYKHRRR